MVCHIHGGKAPQVQQAAARKVLESYIGLALREFKVLLEDQNLAPQVKLAAIRDLLDRTGFRAPQQVEIITIDKVEQEIARLEAEMAAGG